MRLSFGDARASEANNHIDVPGIERATIVEVHRIRRSLREILSDHDTLVKWNCGEWPNMSAAARYVSVADLDKVGLATLRDIEYRITCKVKRENQKRVCLAPIAKSDWTDPTFRDVLLEATDVAHNAVTYASRSLLLLFAWMNEHNITWKVKVDPFVSFQHFAMHAEIVSHTECM